MKDNFWLDPFMVVIYLLLGLSIIGALTMLLIRKWRDKYGSAAYEITVTFNQPLQQPTLITTSVFSARHGRQDELFQKNYPTGEIYTPCEQLQIISRVRKEMKMDTLGTIRFAYKAYFAEFEFSEVPAHLPLLHPDIASLDFDRDGVTMTSTAGFVQHVHYDFVHFSNGHDIILLMPGEPPQTITIQPDHLNTEEHYRLLEELLIKYAVFHQMHF